MSQNRMSQCFAEEKQTPPVFQNGKLVLQKYHIAFLVTGFFALVASVVSAWLVNKHLQWYHNKQEQRYIVRILFLVPIYSMVSLASFVFWNHSTALILIRDGYESTVLTAFFYLLLMYLDHDPDQQKAIFLRVGLSREADRAALRRRQVPRHWIFPLGFLKWKPRDGLLFLQLMKWGVLQYCVIRPMTAFVAVMMNYFGYYCEDSLNPRWGHIYNVIVVSISVSIAMYCLIQLYIPVADVLAPHRPLLKLFAIKAVVFLTFWQATFLGFLSMFHVVKENQYMTAADVNIGIGAFLETFEMMLVAFLHLRAFTYKPYREQGVSIPGYPSEQTPRLRSLGHAMDFRETFREIWVGIIYIIAKMRGREPASDVKPRRDAHYEEAFGRSRFMGYTMQTERAQPEGQGATLPNLQVEVERDVMVDIAGERQWLGVGDDYAYGLEYAKRERSDTLGMQIGRELEKRGYPWAYDRLSTSTTTKEEPPQPHVRELSWWRRMFNRIPPTGIERNVMSSNKTSRIEPPLDDPPPQGILFRQRGQPGEESGGAYLPSLAAPGDIGRSGDHPRMGPATTQPVDRAQRSLRHAVRSVSGLPVQQVADRSLEGLKEHIVLSEHPMVQNPPRRPRAVGIHPREPASTDRRMHVPKRTIAPRHRDLHRGAKRGRAIDAITVPDGALVSQSLSRYPGSSIRRTSGGRRHPDTFYLAESQPHTEEHLLPQEY